MLGVVRRVTVLILCPSNPFGLVDAKKPPVLEKRTKAQLFAAVGYQIGPGAPSGATTRSLPRNTQSWKL